MTHGDQVLLCLTPAGRALADGLTASLTLHGHTVTEAVVTVAGKVQMLELTVHGKRKGEGLIAADVKRRKV